MRNHRFYRNLFLAAGLLTITTLPAMAATDCSLKMLAKVDTTSDPTGFMYVPVSLNGGHKSFLLDTGGFFSELTPSAADELGLSRHHTGTIQMDVTGHPIDQVVTVSDFVLGNLKGSSVEFFVMPDNSFITGVSGVLAPNMLQSYDLDLDFPGHKLALMSPDHCPGQVVYWPHDAIAAVPMTVTEDGHIIFPMELDGHRVQAMLDTGAARTTLTLREAESVFGVGTDSADVEQVGALNNNAGSTIYRHRFKTLTVEGITINNPLINLMPDLMRNHMLQNPYVGSRLSSQKEPQGLPDLLLGMSTLKSLHVYIAYKEQMLYITAGGARAPSPAQGGGTAEH